MIYIEGIEGIDWIENKVLGSERPRKKKGENILWTVYCDSILGTVYLPGMYGVEFPRTARSRR